MKRERPASEQGIGPSNKKRRVTSLPAAASAAMVDVKVEYLTVQEMDGIVVELSSTAMEAYEVVKLALKSLCMVYDVSFRGLLDAV